MVAQTSDDEQEASLRGQAAVWVDSDDERTVVSLASNPRLRKLRLTESEDLVNGREYIKRLRRQFEQLYPVPEWANPSSARKSSQRKRRRSPKASYSSDEAVSSDGMSIDSDDLSAQPLAKLLQSTSNLIRTTDFTASSAHKKLRPEVIDIQRTKDVSDAQPVSLVSTHHTIRLTLQIVRHNLFNIPPLPPASPLLWPFLHPLTTPHLPTPTKPKPSPHLPPHPPHPPHHLPFPSPSRK